MWREEKVKLRKLLNILIHVVFFVVIAMYLGLIPQYTFPTLGTNYVLLGNVSNFSNMVTDSILYPYGMVSYEAHGIIFIGNILDALFCDSQVSLTCTYLMIYLISYVSLVILANKLLKNNFLTFIIILLYYLNPFMTAQMSIPPVVYGLMLTSFSLLLDYIVNFQLTEENFQMKKTILWGLLLLGRLLVVSIGWYTAVIIAVFSCFATLIYYVVEVIQKKDFKIIWKYLLMVIAPWFIAMLVILLITPKGASDFTFSLEWANAGSVAIATLFLPQKSMLISRIIPSISSLLEEGFSLYGDGTMWSNYLGYMLIVSTLVVIFSKTNTLKEKNIKKALMFTGAVGLILSLGPALKILGTYSDNKLDYTMPIENQIVFPWKSLYLFFPFSSMRAVYRWLWIAIIVLYIMAFWGLKKIWERGKKYRLIAIGLCIGAIIEYYPSEGLHNVMINKKKYAEQLTSFEEDVIEPMRTYLKEEDIIVFCNYSRGNNGYPLGHMMEELGTVTYAGSGDKAIATARPYIPEDVINLEMATESQQMIYYITQVFDKGICDAVVLPFFNVREHSYYWAPNESTVDEYKQYALDVVGILDESYKINMEEYFMIIQPKQDVTQNRYELIFDENVQETICEDSSTLFSTNRSICMQAGEVFAKNISIDDMDSNIYVNLYVKSRKTDTATELICEEYNSRGELLKTQNCGMCLDTDFAKYENTFSLDEETKNVVVRLMSAEEIFIKNIQVEPYYESFQDVLQDMSFDGHNTLVINDDSSEQIEKMFLRFEAKVLSEQDCSFISKMDGWCNNMTFDFIIKEKNIVLAITEDGINNYNVYLDKDKVNLEEWNEYQIEFDRGYVSIIVNGDKLCSEETSILQLYNSNIDLEIGSSLHGNIRNIEIQYN